VHDELYSHRRIIGVIFLQQSFDPKERTCGYFLHDWDPFLFYILIPATYASLQISLPYYFISSFTDPYIFCV
jgi:hypothetical protein